MVDENRVTGALNQVKGTIKENVGAAIGDKKMEAEGMADKAGGKVENAVGGAKDTVRDAAKKI